MAADSTGSPTLASREKRSSTRASSSMLIISASAARWASTLPSRVRWGFAAPRRWCLRQLSGCCAITLPRVKGKKICAPGLRATRTTNCAPIWQARHCRRSSAICPLAAFRTESLIEEQAMSLLPVFLKLNGRRGLVIGAGAVALDKIGVLLKVGLRLRVVAPNARPEIQKLAIEDRLAWVQGAFCPPSPH